MQRTSVDSSYALEKIKNSNLGFNFFRANIPENKHIKNEFWEDVFGTDVDIVHKSFLSSDITKPYYPILDSIRSQYLKIQKESKNDILTNIDFYHRQKNIFYDWLKTGKADRDDDLFRSPEEVEWERELIFSTFLQLINLLWNEKNAPVFVLENFEMAGLPLVQFLLWIIENDKKCPLRFVCILNQDSVLLKHWTSEFRHRVFLALEQRGIVEHGLIDFPLEKKQKKSSKEKTNLLSDILLSRSFMAYEEIAGLSNLSGLSENDAMYAGYVIGVIQTLTGNNQQALLFLTKSLETARQTENNEMTVFIHLVSAICDIRSSNITSAEKHILIARNTALETGDKNLNLISDYFRFNINESHTANPENWKELQTLLSDLKKAKMDDRFLELKSSISYYLSCMTIYGWDYAYKEARECLNLAKSLNNLFQISQLYHILGFLFQKVSKGDEAVENLKACIEIRENMNASDELVKSYNGIGYLLLTLGRFKESLEYLTKALNILEPQRKFSEASLTLFNIAHVYLFLGYFSDAQEFLEQVLVVLDNMELESLPFHSRRKIYSIVGCLAYFRNQKSMALDYWNAALKHPLDDQNKPVFALFEYCIQMILNKKEKAKSLLDEALKVKDPDNDLSFSILMYLVRACHRKEEGDIKGSKKDFSYVKKLLKENNRVEQVDFFEHLKNGGNFSNYQKSTGLSERIKVISHVLADSSMQESVNMGLLKKIGDISFLRDFQNAITRDVDGDEIFKNATFLLKRNFPIDGVYFLEDRVSPKVLEANLKLKKIPTKWFWNRLFPSNSGEGLVIHKEITGMMMGYPFKYNCDYGLWAVITVSSDVKHLSIEEQEFVSLALRHLDLTLDLHKATEALKLAATRDTLTGVLSRQEIMNRTENEIQRLNRYKSSQLKGLSIVFIDLDNFKYYNDKFGHPAGDWILQSFVRLLSLCVRDMDCLGRFGGDEFILLLPSADLKDASLVASRILEALKDANGFARELEDELGYSIVIPKEKLLNCSMGISYFDTNNPVSLEVLIDQSDKALYDAKNSGKGIFKIYSS